MSLLRALNEQRVLETLLVEGPQPRAHLARLTGLSTSTLSSAVRDLEAAGMLQRGDLSKDGKKRSSATYEAVRRRGFVFGADVGGTKIRAGIADAFGEILVEQVVATNTRSSGELIDQLGALLKTLAHRAKVKPGLVWAAGVGMPGVYDSVGDRIHAASNLPDLSLLSIRDALVDAMGIPVVVDNDVNLAAVGESWRGLARECPDFVSISIGTGVGMGVVVNGEVLRGARGAAGEIDSLPIGADAHCEVPDRRLLEATVSASALLGRLERRFDANGSTTLSSGDDVARIFEAASRGDQLADELLDEEARYVALAIAAVAGVLDPGLVVLGGGIGSSPFLLDPVRRYVARIHPRPIAIVTSALGDTAAFHGAIAAALRSARELRRGRKQGDVRR